MGIMTETYAIRANVSMYPQDWDIVERLSEALGTSRSGALRIIVRQYDEQSQTCNQNKHIPEHRA